jgi:hypothetical protein
MSTDKWIVGGSFIIYVVDDEFPVDSTGILANSPDGINWNKNTLPSDLFSGGGGGGGGYINSIEGIAYDGKGRWVAVGSGYDSTLLRYVGQIVYSSDGITWIKDTLPSGLFSGGGSNGSANGIAYDGKGRWVAVGFGYDLTLDYNVGQIAYSPDGITWIKDTLPSDLFVGGGGGGGGIYDIAYGQNKWVAVGASNYSTLLKGVGEIAYSSDGINWIKDTLPSDLFAYDSVNGIGSVNGIAYDGKGRWVAVGAGYDSTLDNRVGQIAYSPDGINWFKDTLPSGLFGGGSIVYGIAYDGKGRWVAVGTVYDSTLLINVGQIAYSPDGITWIKDTLPSGLFGGGSIVYGIAYGQNKWVAVGISYDSTLLKNVGQIAYSSDGITWIKDNLSNDLTNNSEFYCVAYGSNPPISNICFPSGTPIKTDQGIIPINEINTSFHTINQKRIKHITKTVTLDNYLISFKKSSISYNCPCAYTVMSKDHKILYMGQLVEAYRFLDHSEDVKKIKYNGEVLYNVLLDEHNVMSVNNIICETLHPNNIIAKLYTSSLSEAYKNNIIYMLNDSLKKKDLASYKTIINIV